MHQINETKKYSLAHRLTFLLLALTALILCGALTANAQAKKSKTEIKFGFLEKFEKLKNGSYQAKIDYAEMFHGAEAEREAKKDGEPSPADTSEIYIRNKNPKIHAEKTDAAAKIILLHELEPYNLSLPKFVKLMNGETKGLPTFWGFPLGNEAMPCHVTLKNGVVTKIEQVYFP